MKTFRILSISTKVSSNWHQIDVTVRITINSLKELVIVDPLMMKLLSVSGPSIEKGAMSRGIVYTEMFLQILTHFLRTMSTTSYGPLVP